MGRCVSGFFFTGRGGGGQCLGFFFVLRGVCGLIAYSCIIGGYHDSRIRFMYRVSDIGVFLHTDLTTAVVHILDQWILFQFTKDAFFTKIDMYKNRGATDAFHRKLSNCNYSINDLIFIHKSPTTCLIITQHRVLHYQVLNATLCYRNINDDYYSILH